MVSAALVHRLGSRIRVVAVQPIQGELNAVEIAAQSDLVRVLTHEIMNSMTPVTSLAPTAAALLAEVDKGANRDNAAPPSAGKTAARPAERMRHSVARSRNTRRTPEARRTVYYVRTLPPTLPERTEPRD